MLGLYRAAGIMRKGYLLKRCKIPKSEAPFSVCLVKSGHYTIFITSLRFLNIPCSLASKFVDHNSTTSVHINRKVFGNWKSKLQKILTGGSEFIVNQA
jgi:hypothetical protein